MRQLVVIYRKNDGPFLIRQVTGWGSHKRFHDKTAYTIESVIERVCRLLKGDPNWNK